MTGTSQPIFSENRQFISNIIDYIGGDTVYIDEAHHRDFNLYSAGTVTITRVLPADRARDIILSAGVH